MLGLGFGFGAAPSPAISPRSPAISVTISRDLPTPRGLELWAAAAHAYNIYVRAMARPQRDPATSTAQPGREYWAGAPTDRAPT